ncbi:MAG: radical SAM family heme chaperone HemW [Sandaracinaceae bacterium]|nr:radical SAM family heme chaperone HemW [Sandaracinaceae bacterium]
MGQGLDTSAYVHFPWCLKKCPYCDFASAAIRRGEVPHEDYTDAIVRELEGRPVAGRRLESVFFGGGTPSLWDPKALGRALAALRGAFDAGGDLEITVECNPTSIDAEKAAALREAGVNRLSIGVQSVNDGRLRFLGRLHDAAGALRALEAVVPVMERVSADLMFGMPGQTADDFEAEIDAVLATGVEHVSAYALTIEPDTQFGALHRKGRLTLAPEGDFADTFERAREVFRAAGMIHYEVSNHALPGRTSQHNQHYWRGGDYLGLGAGAVGTLNGRRYKNDPRPERYLAAPAAAEVFEETLEPDDRVREALMLGLRTDEGVRFDTVQARTGLDARAGRERAIARRVASGDLVVDDERMRIPHERWLHLDGIVADLF